jgi:hypothetical protein
MKNIIIYLLLALSSLVMGCDKFVEVELPNSMLTGQEVFKDPKAVRAALGNIYNKLRDEGMLAGGGTGIGSSMGLYGDELLDYGLNGTPTRHLFNNTLLASDPTVLSFWNSGYYQIYCANAVVEGVDASVSLSQSEKNIFKGEALFIRALVHFYLVNIYGNIPYVSSTDFEANKRISRVDVSKVYQLLVADLKTAEGLMPASYTSAERTTPNSAVASALLARVYLYSQRWSEASAAASLVINNSAYVLKDDLNSAFLKESTATIWQFKPSSATMNAYEGASYIFTTVPPPSISLSNELVAAFEQGDKRRANWVKTLQSGSLVYHHAFKYKQNQSTSSSKEYSIVLRLPEQYLIRAEARVHQGDLTGALGDLNKIRILAGLSNLSSTNPTEILDAIARERRLEFFTEYGHRFFDLKRTGRTSILSLVKPDWDIKDALWPLPEVELLANPMLAPQNPGY